MRGSSIPTASHRGAGAQAQIAATLLVIGHVLLAWYSGGRLPHFLWPALVPIQLAWRLVLGHCYNQSIP